MFLLRSILIFFFCINIAHASSITKQIQQLEKKYQSRIGVSAIHIESGKRVEHRADTVFKMASTMKLPLAITLFKQVQEGKIDLDEMIVIQPHNIIPGSGLMGYFYSRPGLSISVYNLLEAMMAISDNSATDILWYKIGEKQAIQQFLVKNGINDISADRSILEMYFEVEGIQPLNKSEDFSIHNWKQLKSSVPAKVKSASYKAYYNDQLDSTTPRSMTLLMTKLYKQQLLNSEYSKMLLEIMTHTLPQNARISKNLPSNAVVANKTGTWWDIDPVTKIQYNYTNDVALITTPSGEHIALSIYVDSNQGSCLKDHKKIISKISKKIYNFLTKKQ